MGDGGDLPGDQPAEEREPEDQQRGGVEAEPAVQGGQIEPCGEQDDRGDRTEQMTHQHAAALLRWEPATRFVVAHEHSSHWTGILLRIPWWAEHYRHCNIRRRGPHLSLRMRTVFTGCMNEEAFRAYVQKAAGTGAGTGSVAELSHLSALKDKGDITQEEFDRAKAKLLV